MERRRTNAVGLASPLPVAPYRSHGLAEGIGAVGFIQDDQTVVGGKASVNRPHTRTGPVAPEQQPGSELVNGGDYHRGLERRPRPGVVAVHAAPELKDGQGVIARVVGTAIILRSQSLPAGQSAQPVGHLFQDAIPVRLSLLQLAGQFSGPPEGCIHNHASVHHEEDSARRGTFPGGKANLAGQGEDGYVDTGGLAGRRRQRQGFRPGGFAILDVCNPAGQPGLPGEGVVPVKGVEEFIELSCSQIVHATSSPSHWTGRHSPYPR